VNPVTVGDRGSPYHGDPGAAPSVALPGFQQPARVGSMASSFQQLNRHLLRQALDALPAATLLVDAETRDQLILYANDAFAALAGTTVAELTGRSFRTVAAGGAADPGGPWRVRVPGGGALELAARPLYRQPGRPSCWLLTAPVTGATALAPVAAPAAPPEVVAVESALPRSEGVATGTFSSTDLLIRARRDERSDPATGLATRVAFAEMLQRDFALACREQRRVSVLVFAIDAFEGYLGLFGRHAADSCLRKVAHAIASSVRRGGDYCARVGHDRFAVLTTGGDAEGARQHGERIAQRVRDLTIHHPRSLPARYVTVSWQLVTEVPPRAAEDPDLLERAEAAFPVAADAADRARGQSAG
jgi:diguanylate cyclase (GGDEF)-like protein